VKKKEFFDGKWLKAADLPEPKIVTIEIVKRHTFGSDGDAEEKPVVYFKKARKGLVLNGVNWDSIAEIAGSDGTEDWPDTRIELFPTTTRMKGETKPCIRVRKPGDLAAGEQPPPKAKPKQPPIAEELDDEIPF
jgi:hypothetical protein